MKSAVWNWICKSLCDYHFWSFSLYAINLFQSKEKCIPIVVILQHHYEKYKVKEVIFIQ